MIRGIKNMLEIKVDLRQNSIRMSGHAKHNSQGNDIVCAAASMLFYTLAETLAQYEHALKKKARVHIKDDGVDIDAFISCRPKPEYEKNIQTVYFTVINGLHILATNYPQNVSFDIIE